MTNFYVNEHHKMVKAMDDFGVIIHVMISKSVSKSTSYLTR